MRWQNAFCQKFYVPSVDVLETQLVGFSFAFAILVLSIISIHHVNFTMYKQQLSIVSSTLSECAFLLSFFFFSVQLACSLTQLLNYSINLITILLEHRLNTKSTETYILHQFQRQYYILNLCSENRHFSSLFLCVCGRHVEKHLVVQLENGRKWSLRRRNNTNKIKIRWCQWCTHNMILFHFNYKTFVCEVVRGESKRCGLRALRMGHMLRVECTCALVQCVVCTQIFYFLLLLNLGKSFCAIKMCIPKKSFRTDES